MILGVNPYGMYRFPVIENLRWSGGTVNLPRSADIAGLVVTDVYDTAGEINIEGNYPGLTGKKYANKEAMLDAELPRSGDGAFIDPKPKKRGNHKYMYDKKGNPLDEQGRPYVKDKREQHWDRQEKDGGHTRITPDGKILSLIFYEESSKITILNYKKYVSKSSSGKGGDSYVVTNPDGSQIKRTNIPGGFRDENI